MASKLRPGKSLKGLLNMTAEELRGKSDRELKAIVSKLNDAANKRLNRLKSSGLADISPAARARAKGKGKFTLDRKMKRSEITTAYLEAKKFLSPESTSTKRATLAYNRKFDKAYGGIYEKAKMDPNNLDKRYKTRQVLKKSTMKKKVREFWKGYEEFREIDKQHNPDKYKGDTNIQNVEEYEEELYGEGLTSEEDYEEYAEEGYEEEEDYYDEEELDDYGELEDEATDEEPETPAVQPPKANGRGTKGTKRNKQPREGKSPFGKVKFEKIKIF